MKIRNPVYYLNRNRHNFCGEYVCTSKQKNADDSSTGKWLPRSLSTVDTERTRTQKSPLEKTVHSLNCGSSYSNSPMRRTEILCLRVENWRNIELPASYNHLQYKGLESRRASFVEQHPCSNLKARKQSRAFSAGLCTRISWIPEVRDWQHWSWKVFLHPPLHFSSPVQQIQCVAEFPSQARKLWF